MPFPKLEARKFASIRELNGISARTMEEHYELYKGYVGKTNEIQEKLASVDRASANQIFSDLRALRVDLSFAIGGVKNHEIYFGHLGGKGGAPSGKLAELIARAVKDSLDRFLLPALAGPLQILPLSALTRKDLTTLALRRAAEKGRLKAVRRSAGWYSTKQWVDTYARSRRRGSPAHASARSGS